MLERAVKTTLVQLAGALAKTKAGSVFTDVLLQSGLNRSRTVRHGDLSLDFATPNALLKMRADTFSTKEPETLEWIDGFDADKIFWDIGANVGLYSLYAAKSRNCRVIAFEPSVFNLEWLARNIWMNDLTDNVQIIPLALSSTDGFQMMNFSSVDWGGALSHFGEVDMAPSMHRYDSMQYKMMGLNPDHAVASGLVPQPDYIKIDVDGIEHEILRGMRDTLSSVKAVLVEVDVAEKGQREACGTLLSSAGLKLALKKPYYLNGIKEPVSENQIWTRY